MSGKPILTNRELKNKATGIDLYVSDYQEIPHRLKNTFLYHVIVVTNLFYYKDREHRESDVVQFMVSKSFEEFEDLYSKLYKRFPSVNFPSLPSKTLLSSNVNAKLQCMDEVLKLVAVTQKLCSSPMVLSFLKGERQKDVQKKEEEQKKETPVEVKKQEDIEEVEDEDLFKNKAETKNTTEDKVLSEEPVKNLNSSNTKAQSLFEEDSNENDDDIFSPASVSKGDVGPKYDELDGEDESSLTGLTDDLDELLALRRNSIKQSAIKVQKPVVTPRQKTSQSNNTDLFTLEDEEKDSMFKQPRTQSFKKDRKSDDISDIFQKNKTSSLFENEADDDLFKSSTVGNVDSMQQDDILSYINNQQM
ncbi:HCLS1-binding protein 3-like [Hydractinia symbiolongicarpus]|uniref:HCLS1-binding protein 3-like n=1 Tax=Hydractinia symbiolongicarpus TaxID=13093 RepID=UPI0025505F49|nr:HCLS1-binding protein 3-like [Hydractinia symbiolongicarpus]